LYNDIGVIGIDLWQVKSGTIFDNIFIGDDNLEEIKQIQQNLFNKEKEKEMFDQKNKNGNNKNDEDEKEKEENLLENNGNDNDNVKR